MRRISSNASAAKRQAAGSHSGWLFKRIPRTKPKPVQRFTREELESIADCEGIAGLRQIGNQIGVKAKGIVEMIEGILKAQGGE